MNTMFHRYIERNRRSPVPPVPPLVTAPECRFVTVKPTMASDTDADRPEKRPPKGWSLADERACTARCRYCRQPVVWGEVPDHEPNGARTDWTRVATNRRWMPLDPDMFPHGCDSSRLGSVEAATEGRLR